MNATNPAPEPAPLSCPLDQDGFLTNPEAWDEATAIRLAAQDHLELSLAHWTVLHFLRRYYVERKTAPIMREVRQGTALPVAELFRLFPLGGPLMQGAKLAGLPKPSGCK